MLLEPQRLVRHVQTPRQNFLFHLCGTSSSSRKWFILPLPSRLRVPAGRIRSPQRWGLTPSSSDSANIWWHFTRYQQGANWNRDLKRDEGWVICADSSLVKTDFAYSQFAACCTSKKIWLRKPLASKLKSQIQRGAQILGSLPVTVFAGLITPSANRRK